MKKEYWMTIIGPTTRDKLEQGADSPMRNSVCETFEETTGHDSDICHSGWGLTEKRKELLLDLWSVDEEIIDNMYNVYIRKKKLKRILK